MFGTTYRSLCQIQSHSSSAVKFSTNLLLQNYTIVKQSKIMNKLLKNSKSKKKKFYSFPISAGTNGHYFEHISNHKTSHKGDKRLTVLNKVFMRNITDLMSTGELCPEINGRGIQISKVNVTPTYHQINVHWFASGTEDDNETEKLLSEFAPKLRHELSQLRVMGNVPKIEFIKDLSYLKYMVVENILKTADFGDEFEPTTLANDWNSNDVLQPSVASDFKEDDNKDEECIPNKVEQPLPVMRMDTLGIDHEAIMKRITNSIQRAKAAHRRDVSINLSHDDESAELNETSAILNAKERKKLLRDFILKKKLEFKKFVNDEKKYRRPELVIYEQEMENKLASEFLKYDEEEYLEDFDRNSNYLEDGDDNARH